jgi:hypothetical protein
MYSGQGVIRFPIDAAAGVGGAETSKPIAFIAGVSDDDFGSDRNSFGIFISRKGLLPPPVDRQRAMLRCPYSDKVMPKRLWLTRPRFTAVIKALVNQNSVRSRRERRMADVSPGRHAAAQWTIVNP